MKRWRWWALFVAGALAGCAAAGTQGDAQSPADPGSPAGSPFSDRRMGVHSLGTPLILDRTDLRIGTTVQFNRLPTISELHDAVQVPALAHVVLALPFWPDDLGPLDALNILPPEADVIVVLPGYPPNRSAAQAWNRVTTRLRIIAVLPGEPASNAVVDDLNLMRGLERVIVQVDEPSRMGFDRLQRPLSFRKVVE